MTKKRLKIVELKIGDRKNEKVVKKEILQIISETKKHSKQRNVLLILKTKAIGNGLLRIASLVMKQALIKKTKS